MGEHFLLDTNAASDLFKKKSPALRERWLEAKTVGNMLAISVLTHAEILFGFAQNPSSTRMQLASKGFLANSTVLPWTLDACASYAQLPLHLKSRRLVVDTMDLLIASQAHALGATVITRDNHFRHVSELVKVVNWATDLK